MNNKKANYNKKGFTIFIALIVISVSLIVGVGMANLIAKEIEFSSISRKTQVSFYAADTGTECVLYWDIKESKFLKPLDIGVGDNINNFISPPYNCVGEDITSNWITTDVSEPSPGVFEYTIDFDLDLSNNSCVNINIKKQEDADPNTPMTLIQSSGKDRNCSSSDPNRVERILEINY